ncbi:MAG TPA: DUF262 domain-containing protein [Candidatus Limnocylindrales bacterium]|nr:DUF262 domain-containing protein [Candidatus Limnocylindrales bacterium]
MPAHPFTVGKALAWRSAIDIDPPYQRPADAWDRRRQQRFIDSLLNGFDVPKFYLHDVRGGPRPTIAYAVVDGKQRLTAMWSYLEDGFGLADDFVSRSTPPGLETAPPPVAGMRFSEIPGPWRSALRQTYLSVVLIQDATLDEIEELFERLNSGVPLATDHLARRR